MITRLGMSQELGPMVYGQKDELIFLGREIGEQRDYSESVAEQIDAEVKKIVEKAFDRAMDILKDYRPQLDLVAESLIEIETLDRSKFEELFSEPVGPKNSGTPMPVGTAAD
jgi:cell division protease FtsH